MDKQIRKEVISILVDNQANVLTRVSSLFGRRGFNIDSLTVSATNDPKLSRITVVFTGTEQGLHQIITQTAKLEVVKKIFTLDSNDSIYRELLLLKVKADKEERSAIKEVVEIQRKDRRPFQEQHHHRAHRDIRQAGCFHGHDELPRNLRSMPYRYHRDRQRCKLARRCGYVKRTRATSPVFTAGSDV